MLRSFIGLNRRAAKRAAERWPVVFGTSGPSYLDEIRNRVRIVIAECRPASVLEAGGVDRPILPRSPEYRFIGLDIEKRPECANLYDEFIVQSIESPIPAQVDMIVSLTLLEHVPDNRRAISAMFHALRPGGSMHHYVPSALHPYSLILRFIGPRLQKRLIPIVRPGTEEVSGYPAFFDHCTPKRMERLLRDQGFAEVQIQPYYRANDYFAFFLPLFGLVSAFENVCKALKIRTFASGFVVSAVKPTTSM